MSAPDNLWRVTVGQYHAMIERGVLTANDPVELLEGFLVQKMPKNPARRIATGSTREALAALAPAGWYVDGQEPITLGDSEPEPDVMVVRGATRDYSDRHPGPGEVGLIVEVADSSINRDSGMKKRIYASAGIPVYWIIDLVNRRVEVHSQPRGGIYRTVSIHGAEDDVPVVLDGETAGAVPARALLP